MARSIRRNERDIDFLVLCQKKQNRKVLTNSVTMLSTMFKVVAEKYRASEKSLSSIWCTYTSAEGAEDGVAKFTSLVRARD